MKRPSKLVIAVDGPAAAGKGTLAKALAQALGLPYLDTGLLYRAVARRTLDAGADPREDATSFAKALEPRDLERKDLREAEIDQAASLVAKQPGVRAALLERQRHFGQVSGAVIDGRDIGTVVFPQADMKFFITASPEIRAQRRYLQRFGSLAVSHEGLQKEIDAIIERDQQDASRDVAPLKPAQDAVEILTDQLSAEDVLQKALEIMRKRGFVE
ncbi:(d)CMP kinase [Aristophania vespae]|uniref:(d)CMP kinase n=1 Tax=Aristophania vespae TaxID=2697033 RepID=UPI002351788A|nr:(d)CMP kinase [Aristophania vespae]UMM64258.1 Cytidylate kinase [Aristophania vespae]